MCSWSSSLFPRTGRCVDAFHAEADCLRSHLFCSIASPATTRGSAAPVVASTARNLACRVWGIGFRRVSVRVLLLLFLFPLPEPIDLFLQQPTIGRDSPKREGSSQLLFGASLSLFLPLTFPTEVLVREPYCSYLFCE